MFSAQFSQSFPKAAVGQIFWEGPLWLPRDTIVRRCHLRFSWRGRRAGNGKNPFSSFEKGICKGVAEAAEMNYGAVILDLQLLLSQKEMDGRAKRNTAFSLSYPEEPGKVNI